MTKPLRSNRLCWIPVLGRTMAYDKRFGIDIPSDKQKLDEWSKRQFVLGLQAKIKEYYAMGKDMLAFKHAELLAKVQKFAEQTVERNTNNVMFVTRFENEEAWAKQAKLVSKNVKSIDAKADLATDSEQQSGSSGSDGS